MAMRAGTIGLGVVLGDTILCAFAVDPGDPDDHRSYGRKRKVTTPRRGLLFHFTHMSNLAAIARDGLHCDSEVTDTEMLLWLSNRRWGWLVGAEPPLVLGC